MSTSKHIDKICLIAVAVILILTILFMTTYNSMGTVQAGHTMGYEDRLFNTSKVHTVDIVMNDWDSFIEGCESEEYSSCTVVIDGEKYSNIAIRAKGNTSLSNVSSLGSQRYSFKLEFDHYQDGVTYHGLDKLCLNNIIQDNTMMKDYLVYRMMAEFGVDSPLCSYVYITVNGEDWGLYLAVEGVEDSFLQRNYGSDVGDLYKPDSLSFGGGRGNGQDFNMEDFDFSNINPGDFDFSQMGPGRPSDSSGPSADSSDSSVVASDSDASASGSNTTTSDSSGSDNKGGFGFGGGGGFDFKNMMGGFGGMGSDDVKLKYIDDNASSYSNIFSSAKTDVSEADQNRLISSLKSLTEYTDLENVLDMDEVLRYFVVHIFVVNGDSYTGSMIHNYYLHESDGALSMIPWDYNLAFGTFTGGDASSSINSSIDSPISGGDVNDRPMVGWIFSDEEYTEAYHTLFAEFISEWIDSGKLTQLISDTADMIRPYVEKDPTKFCTTEEFETGVETISQFVTLRGEAVSRQLAGDNTAVETNGLNTSDMGSMASTGGMGGDMGGGMPTMPDGASFDGSNMPSLPDGASFDGSNMPSMPDDASFDGSNMPTMPGGGGFGGGFGGGSR